MKNKRINKNQWESSFSGTRPSMVIVGEWVVVGGHVGAGVAVYECANK